MTTAFVNISPAVDPVVEEAMLAINFGIGGLPDTPEVPTSLQPVGAREPISRQALAAEWFRAMRRASAYHQAYRVAVTALAHHRKRDDGTTA